jgi:5'-deoxynucleotidase YfbR-like HD superfamily hydrolase
MNSSVEDYTTANAWIQTFTGRKFNFLNPDPQSISIEDIGQALSQQCRFSGHLRWSYSVAQHSVLCSLAVDTRSPIVKIQALMHDAQEAYVVDLPRPLKRCGKIVGYDEIEEACWLAVAKRFDIPPKLDSAVKEVDTRMMMTERRDLMSTSSENWATESFKPYSFRIEPWIQDYAKHRFIKRFFELNNEIVFAKMEAAHANLG